MLYPVIIGLAIAQFDFGAEHDTAAAEDLGAGAAAAGAVPAGPTTSIAAEGNAFNVEEIVLAAKKEASLQLVYEDSGVDHNVAIYEDESAATEIFEGDVVTGPGSITYEFAAPPKGEYYFQCDIHPDMNGTVVSE